MKKRILFSALIAFAIFTACTKQAVEDTVLPADIPVQAATAAFTIDNNHGTVNENAALLLSNKSVNAVSYEWSFGNGDKSTEANPTYKYKIHGNYTVTLTITDARGNIQQASHEVVVLCIFGGGSHDE